MRTYDTVIKMSVLFPILANADVISLGNHKQFIYVKTGETYYYTDPIDAIVFTSQLLMMMNENNSIPWYVVK